MEKREAFSIFSFLKQRCVFIYLSLYYVLLFIYPYIMCYNEV